MLGPLLIGIESTALTAADRSRLQHGAVGGVVLFGRNYAGPEQLRSLTAQIRGLRRPPLLVAVDQEGGRIQRFREGFTRLPAPAALGQVYDIDPGHGRYLARLAGWVTAVELRACGVDLSLAPVLDLDYGLSAVLAERALHRRAEVVAALGLEWMAGARLGGMAAVGKHFPGHGAVTADSHTALPCDDRTLAEIAGADLLPFQRAVAGGVPGVMTAHVTYPEVDDRPASLSPRWVSGILRERLGHRGAVVSDDLGMAAAASAGTLAERIAGCLGAGSDAVIVGDPELVDEALGSAAAWQDRAPEAAALRLARLHAAAPGAGGAATGSAAHREAVEALTALLPGVQPDGGGGEG